MKYIPLKRSIIGSLNKIFFHSGNYDERVNVAMDNDLVAYNVFDVGTPQQITAEEISQWISELEVVNSSATTPCLGKLITLAHTCHQHPQFNVLEWDEYYLDGLLEETEQFLGSDNWGNFEIDTFEEIKEVMAEVFFEDGWLAEVDKLIEDKVMPLIAHTLDINKPYVKNIELRILNILIQAVCENHTNGLTSNEHFPCTKLASLITCMPDHGVPDNSIENEMIQFVLESDESWEVYYNKLHGIVGKTLGLGVSKDSILNQLDFPLDLNSRIDLDHLQMRVRSKSGRPNFTTEHILDDVVMGVDEIATRVAINAINDVTLSHVNVHLTDLTKSKAIKNKVILAIYALTDH